MSEAALETGDTPGRTSGSTSGEAVGGTVRLRRRLTPLAVGVGLLGMMLWVPVEKLFMSEIGFTPVTIGIMAGVYAGVVPLLEVPSGILADRSSRNLVMVGAAVALLASQAVGAAAQNVATYMASAALLGVYFALNSGTVDSMVYDTVMEETGSSDLYETWIGRVRLVESGALVVSALAGGILADLTSPRLTYWATLPFTAVAALAFLRFDEPRLHRAAEPVRLREHVAVTFGAMARTPAVRRVMLLCATAALLSQAVFEFGPLWLVALAAPAVLFGPYWAALVSTLGVGGFLAGKLDVDRASVAVGIAVGMPAVTVALAVSHSLAAAIAAQTLLLLALAVIGIHAGRLLHDAVSPEIRTGVSSGVGTLSWLFFLPFSVFLGWFARKIGVVPSGWVLVAVSALVGLLLVVSARRLDSSGARPDLRAPEAFACRDLVELVMDHIDGVLARDLRAEVAEHLSGCDGCVEYLAQIHQTINGLSRLDP